MELVLRLPTVEDEQAFLSAHAATSPGVPTFLHYYEEGMPFGRYLDTLAAHARGEHLPDGHVPSTFLFAFSGPHIVGRTSIRHTLTPDLERFGQCPLLQSVDLQQVADGRHIRHAHIQGLLHDGPQTLKAVVASQQQDLHHGARAFLFAVALLELSPKAVETLRPASLRPALLQRHGARQRPCDRQHEHIAPRLAVVAHDRGGRLIHLLPPSAAVHVGALGQPQFGVTP